MEQNHQITLTEWMEMKEAIRKELNNVKHSFVRVGYYLRRIDEDKAYIQDGYRSLADFAREEYGINPTTVSRFMSINRKYSVDGYSRELLPEYDGYKQSVLIEMLALPAEDMQIVTPEMSREDVREIARFNRAAGEQGNHGNSEVDQEDDQNYKNDNKSAQDEQEGGQDNRENARSAVKSARNGDGSRENETDQAAAGGILSSDELAFMLTVYGKIEEETEELEKLLDGGNLDEAKIQEVLAPSGSRTYRSGLYMLVMTDKGVSIKRMGKDTIFLSYRELLEETADLIRDHMFLKRKEEKKQREQAEQEDAARRQQQADEKQRKVEAAAESKKEQAGAAKTQQEKTEAAGSSEPGRQDKEGGISDDSGREAESKKEELPQESKQSSGQEDQGDGKSHKGAEEIDNGSHEAAGKPEGHDRDNDGSTGGTGGKSGMAGEEGEPDHEGKTNGVQAIAPAQQEHLQGEYTGKFDQEMNPPLPPVPEETGIRHSLRIWPEYFEAVRNGTKTFELRKDDRDFTVGDTLELMEFEDGRYTGRSMKKRITYKLSDFDGIQSGYCILSIQDI